MSKQEYEHEQSHHKNNLPCFTKYREAGKAEQEIELDARCGA